MSSVGQVTGPLRKDGLHVVKAHGTGNDFVVVVDPEGSFEVGPELAAALCDRRRGLGGDGIIRIVRSRVESPEGEVDGWSMDHRNADGSHAEMCGNGVRVLAHVLVRSGLVAPDVTGVPVLTRSGPRPVRVVAAGYAVYAVQMGPVVVSDEVAAVSVLGAEAGPGTPERVRRLPGVGVDVSNPHVVVDVGSAAALAAVDLAARPGLDPDPVDGANVELMTILGTGPTTGSGHLRMRVHERGVGETQSCGTGAVAAAAAAGSRTGAREWLVDVPGGRLTVRLRRREGEGIIGSELAGPAEVVADAVISHDWLASVSTQASVPDVSP